MNYGIIKMPLLNRVFIGIDLRSLSSMHCVAVVLLLGGRSHFFILVCGCGWRERHRERERQEVDDRIDKTLLNTYTGRGRSKTH